MQLQVEIQFDDLLKMVKSLPASQLSTLKKELELSESSTKTIGEDLKTLLLNGPVATKRQLDTIEKNRKAINQWRTK